MNIQVGRTYVDRQGAQIAIQGCSTDGDFPFWGPDADCRVQSFTPSGSYYQGCESPYDLVAEVPAEADPPSEPFNTAQFRGAHGASPLPEDSAERKRIPLCTGLLDYFPAALAAVATHSLESNEKHNPGEPMHWARGKSMDHPDCLLRHLVDARAASDRRYHLTALVWRALAMLQEEFEAHGAPVPPGAR